jgi:multidrug efflux pump subunit AcrA (membrane-fusion protein)
MEQARADAEKLEGADAEAAQARAEMHERWAAMHAERSNAHAARAARDSEGQQHHEQVAAEQEQLALASEQRVGAAKHRAAAEELGGAREAVERTQAELEEADRREREAQEREQRIRDRIARRRSRDTAGLRRYRPGPGSGAAFGSLGTAGHWTADDSDDDLDREIDMIARALAERGPTERDQLAELVGARYWGPGRFRHALREALDEGRVRRLSRSTYAPTEQTPAGTSS